VTVPSPFADPESWDQLTIGGQRFRGTFHWGGDLIKRKLDHRHAAGRDGARVRDKGYDLAELDLTLTITTDDEWSDFVALVALVFPRAATPTTRNAHGCAHPELALAGITEIYGTSMGPPTQASPTKWEVTLKFVEYRAVAQARRNVSRTPQAAPDLGANNPTAFGPPAPTSPPTPPAAPGPARP
jgi:hypothetical protein